MWLLAFGKKRTFYLFVVGTTDTRKRHGLIFTPQENRSSYDGKAQTTLALNPSEVLIYSLYDDYTQHVLRFRNSGRTECIWLRAKEDLSNPSVPDKWCLVPGAPFPLECYYLSVQLKGGRVGVHYINVLIRRWAHPSVSIVHWKPFLEISWQPYFNRLRSSWPGWGTGKQDYLKLPLQTICWQVVPFST